jgi:hypothetical protein
VHVVGVRFGSPEVLLHRWFPKCGCDRAHFLPSDFIMCFYKVTLQNGFIKLSLSFLMCKSDFMRLWVTLVT